MSSIVITGMGIVSAIGIGQQETLESLRSMRGGVAPVHYLATEHRECMVGEVKLTDDEMIARLGIAAHVATVRTSLLGMIALGEALADAGLSANDLPQTAFVNGTTVGGMDKSERYYTDFLAAEDAASLPKDGEVNTADYIRTHDCGASTDLIADHFGRFAMTTTISTACSSAANAFILGARLIASGEYDRVVVGGAESLSKFHLNGFNTLMILDQQPCRPMDATRAGLNLGEGAAYVVLESEASAHARHAHILGELAGYGNACDAFHQTASSADGEGAFRAMRQALQRAGIEPSAIDYVNCHGTGTPNNDPSELAAMRRVFGDHLPAFSSTKGFTGHTTSASGSIEAVFCLLAMRHGFLPANLHCSQPIEPWAVPVAQTTSATPRYVLCNAFGFGGNDTAIILATPSRPPRGEENNPKIYVQAANQISIQQPLSEEWLDNPVDHSEALCRAIDPDFRDYVSPVEGRRMGKLLKRALATSLKTLRDCGIEQPDAIITGTGLGSVESTEAFLLDLCQNGEQLLKPTHFMQSTHNTIGSLVAIQTKCHGYNATYSHATISFESALADAMLQLRAGDLSNALVLGQDATTERYYHLFKLVDYVREEMDCPCGEASVATLLTSSEVMAHGNAPLCELVGVKLLHRPTAADWKRALEALAITDTDGLLVFVGENGHPKNDELYGQWLTQFLPTAPVVRYKKWFGECFSASALGFYAAAHWIHAGRAEKVLLLNIGRDGNAALTLLKR